MHCLLKDFSSILNVLKRKQFVSISEDGQWQIESLWWSKIKQIWPFQSSYKRTVCHFSRQLDSLEKKPLFVNEANEQHHQMLLLGEALLAAFEHPLRSCDEIHDLKLRLLSLKYRLESAPLHFSRSLFLKLKAEAEQWKKRQPLILIKQLTINDLKELKKVARHREFIEVILKSQKHKELFFEWSIRDQNNALAFIQFPALVERLIECQLNGRISCHKENALKIQKFNVKGQLQKVVTLPFEGKDRSILDENEIVAFRGSVKATIFEIFEVFKNKDHHVGYFEFMKEGIINWNIHHLGYWDATKNEYQKINIELDEWWRQLPLFEVLTKEEVTLRYSWSLKGKEWIAAASATRGLASLSYEKTHAFLELAIPIGKGVYGIYDFGKLAYQYPCSMWETLDMFCRNVHSTIAYPDENVFCSQRQHALHPFKLTAKQGLALMELIKQDMLRARAYNLVYQIESENCAKWVQTKLEAALGEGKVPNLYKMQLLDTEPESAVSKIFALIKKLPHQWQVPMLSALHLPIGAAKKTWIIENGRLVAKSLVEHHFFSTGQVYLPAFMHHQLIKGILKGPHRMQKLYFAVGLLCDKHKFGFLIFREMLQKAWSNNELPSQAFNEGSPRVSMRLLLKVALLE
ncbi:MAG: hypothetical protein ACSNEK_05985 [Parachlamydiaceae bacterium]